MCNWPRCSASGTHLPPCWAVAVSLVTKRKSTLIDLGGLGITVLHFLAAGSRHGLNASSKIRLTPCGRRTGEPYRPIGCAEPQHPAIVLDRTCTSYMGCIVGWGRRERLSSRLKNPRHSLPNVAFLSFFPRLLPLSHFSSCRHVQRRAPFSPTTRIVLISHHECALGIVRRIECECRCRRPAPYAGGRSKPQSAGAKKGSSSMPKMP